MFKKLFAPTDMTKGSVWKSIVMFTLPMLIGNVAQQFYSTVDTIVVGQYAENGDIVACLVDGESATVKRFRKERRRIVLSPENEDYSPILLSPEDFETGRARILGVAIEAKTKF